MINIQYILISLVTGWMGEWVNGDGTGWEFLSFWKQHDWTCRFPCDAASARRLNFVGIIVFLHRTSRVPNIRPSNRTDPPRKNSNFWVVLNSLRTTLRTNTYKHLLRVCPHSSLSLTPTSASVSLWRRGLCRQNRLPWEHRWKPPFFSVNSTPSLGKYIFSRFHNVFLLESNGHGHDSWLSMVMSAKILICLRLTSSRGYERMPVLETGIKKESGWSGGS